MDEQPISPSSLRVLDFASAPDDDADLPVDWDEAIEQFNNDNGDGGEVFNLKLPVDWSDTAPLIAQADYTERIVLKASLEVGTLEVPLTLAEAEAIFDALGTALNDA